MAKILDACCGSRMFWFDKQNPNVTFMDIRQEYDELETGHVVDVNPDIVGISEICLLKRTLSTWLSLIHHT